jgi:hypothetical protein
LLPPSRTPDGEYILADSSKPEPVPYFLAERVLAMRNQAVVADVPDELDTPTSLTRARQYLYTNPGGREGFRNQSAFNHAATLRDLGISEPTALQLLTVWDETNLPPLGDELALPVWSAYHGNAQNTAGSKAVEPAAGLLTNVAKPPPVYRLRHPGQLSTLKRSPSLIDGILPAQGTGILYAPPGSFKSFIALGMAFAVATGRAAFARYSVNRTGPVIYCAGEGHLAVATQRLPALFTQHGIPMTEETPLYLLNGVPLARGDETAAQFIASVHSQIKEPPALLVIDTMARSLAGLKENDASEAGRFVDLIETLASNLECFVLAVGHEGKDGSKGVRGSSAVEAGVDVIWQARRPSETSSGVSLHSKKDKDGDTHGVVYLLGQKVGDSVVFAAKEEAEWNQSSGKRPGVVSASDVGHALDDLGAREGKTVNNRILAEHLAGPSGDENTIGAKEKALKRGIMVGNLLSYVVHQSIGTRDPTLWSIPSTDQE